MVGGGGPLDEQPRPANGVPGADAPPGPRPARRRRWRLLIGGVLAAFVLAAGAIGLGAWLRSRAVAENEVALAGVEPEVNAVMATIPASWGEAHTERELDHQGWAIRRYWFTPTTADHCPELERAVSALGDVDRTVAPPADMRCSWYATRQGAYVVGGVSDDGSIFIHIESLGSPLQELVDR